MYYWDLNNNDNQGLSNSFNTTSYWIERSHSRCFGSGRKAWREVEWCCCFVSLFYFAGASAAQQSFELELSSINRLEDWGTNVIRERLNSF